MAVVVTVQFLIYLFLMRLLRSAGNLLVLRDVHRVGVREVRTDPISFSTTRVKLKNGRRKGRVTFAECTFPALPTCGPHPPITRRGDAVSDSPPRRRCDFIRRPRSGISTSLRSVSP